MSERRTGGGASRESSAKEVGVRLQAARRAAGLSQTDVCARLEMDPAVLSRWENGLWFPKVVYLRRLADIYGVSIDSLLGREGGGDDFDWPEGSQFLRRAGKELTPEAKAAMIKAMEAFMEMNRQRRGNSGHREE